MTTVDRSVADELHAAAVRSALENLNGVIHHAAEAGLLVSVGIYDRQELGRAHPVPVLHATVSRPL